MGLDLPGAEDVWRGEPSDLAADAETMVLLQGCLPGGTCSSSYIALEHEKCGEWWRKGRNYCHRFRVMGCLIISVGAWLTLSEHPLQGTSHCERCLTSNI